MKDVKIYYKDDDRINEEFEMMSDALMQKIGLERWASGFDLCEGVRDIAYREPKPPTQVL